MSDRDWLARLLLPRRLLLNSVNLAESRRHHLGLTGALSGTANWHRWYKDTISFVHEELGTVELSEVEMKVLLCVVIRGHNRNHTLFRRRYESTFNVPEAKLY